MLRYERPSHPPPMLFADVIIPGFYFSKGGLFTYSVPESLSREITPGSLVEVPLRNKKYRGLIFRTHQEKPTYTTKDVIKIFPGTVLAEWQLKLIEQVAEYYCTSLEAVAKLFLPNKIWQGKYVPKKEIIVQLNQKNDEISMEVEYVVSSNVERKMSPKMQEVIDLVKEEPRQLETVRKELGTTSAYLKELEKKEVIHVVKKNIQLQEALFPEKSVLKKVQNLIQDLQFGALLLPHLKDIFGSSTKKVIDEAELRGWIKTEEREIAPQTQKLESGFLKELNPEQQKVVDHFTSQTAENLKPTLLHGITGSGKTEVYLHLIYDAVQKGKQSILLVPEIALTPQVVRYFSRIFGDRLAILHSRLSEGEKCDHWYNVFRGRAKVVIGSRSALFAPIQNPGVVIIDEEHEWTYKQDKTPRYHTRKVAEIMGKITGCNVVFGSATPDIETYYKSQKNEYHYTHLHRKAKHVYLGKEESFLDVTIVDLRDEFHKKNMSMLSTQLQQKIAQCLERNEQVILFLNKRGSHSAVVCRECGHIEACPVCDVKLTHHTTFKSPAGKLLCHHCGHIQNPPEICPKCKSPNIRYVGVGTQKVEAEIKRLFPQARVLRADRDTTKKKHDFQKLYEDFSDRKIDILVGTQMVTKGFDFPYVTLVGVILAETTLYIPDFRSPERMFQLLTQVFGLRE